MRLFFATAPGQTQVPGQAQARRAQLPYGPEVQVRHFEFAFVFVTDVRLRTLQSEQASQFVPEPPSLRNILFGQNNITGPIVDGTNLLGFRPHLTFAIVPNTEVAVCVRETVNPHCPWSDVLSHRRA